MTYWSITPEERERRLGIIKRALDWLEKWPMQHIGNKLAATAKGHPVGPRSKSAVCYCALGRIVAEGNIRRRPNGPDPYDEFFAPLGVTATQIHLINDHHIARFNKPAAIRNLRRYLLEGERVL